MFVRIGSVFRLCYLVCCFLRVPMRKENLVVSFILSVSSWIRGPKNLYGILFSYIVEIALTIVANCRFFSKLPFSRSGMVFVICHRSFSFGMIIGSVCTVSLGKMTIRNVPNCFMFYFG